MGCPGAQNAVAPPAATAPAAAPVAKEPVVVRPSKTGLGFRLSDAEPPPEEHAARPPAVPLTPEQTKQLFDRLPPLKADADDAVDFALRAKSLPAPRPGETVKEAFPPPVTGPSPAKVAVGPLRVTREEPEGDVELAPYVSVTFSAPMVPITSHAELDKLPVPVKIAPQPPGRWRWIGAQTALFQPEPRMPMATDYTVTVDPGIASATGAVLAEGHSYKFSTPALRLKERGPTYGSIKLDPVIFARFDQAIDPEALVQSMRVTQGGQAVKVRLATEDEIAADEQAQRIAETRDDQAPLSLGIGDYHPSAGGQYSAQARTKRTRLLAVKPAVPLPPDVAVTVTFPAGTGSLEGPKRTKADQTFGFHTYGPLRVTQHECYRCDPFSAFSVGFSNNLELSKFDESMVSVTPAIPGMKVTLLGSSMVISGRKKGRQKYTVTVSGGLEDVFGQTLGVPDAYTFSVGPAQSVLFSEDQPMVVLDPATLAAGPSLPVFSVNDPLLHVRLFAVTPQQFAAYETWRRDWDYDGKLGTPPGKLVFDKVVGTAKLPDELTETKIRLAPALSAGLGQVLAVVETTRPFPPDEPWRKQWVREWIQVTRLGLQAVSDGQQAVAWTTSLKDGAPVAGATVSSSSGNAKTGAGGLATVLAEDPLVASKGGDLTFLPHGVRAWSGTPNAIQFFTFDDRKTYKPGEDVHVKGWVRQVGYTKGGDVALVPDSAGTPLHWVAKDARNAELSKGDTTVDPLGGFDFVVNTPNNANLGSATVTLELGPNKRGTGYHAFEIQEFRRPEFEVHANATPGPSFVGQHAIATVEAKYYAGGGLPDAEVTWTVNRSVGHFTPPNQDAYVFGKTEGDSFWSRAPAKAERTTETWTGRTDPSGGHRLRVDFDALEPAYPMSLTLQGSVMDVNRQAWSASTSMLVHPADVSVGLKLAKSFVDAGESIQADAIVVDVDGKPVPDRAVSVKSARLDWRQGRSGFEEKEVEEQTCEFASGAAAHHCALPTKGGGQYRVTAVVTDALGRKSQTVTRLWVMDQDSPPDRRLSGQHVEVIADKSAYAAGDTAELLVVAPFSPAEGTLVLARMGILSTERFSMTSAMTRLKVKVDGSLTPNVHAYVLLAGSAPREDEAGSASAKLERRPAYAEGSVNLSIPPRDRTLALTVAPRDKTVDPAGRTTVDVDVKDAQGAPVPGAEVAVIVVDESILALSSYTLPDPLGAFYPQRAPGVVDAQTRAFITLAKPDDAKLQSAMRRAEQEVRRLERAPRHAPGGGGNRGWGLGALGNGSGGASKPDFPAPAPSAPAPRMQLQDVAAASVVLGGAAPVGSAAVQVQGKLEAMPTTPIAVRTDFGALAVFEPSKRTDALGHLEVPVKLPDSVTRYRVMAVAAAREHDFGAEESTITARLPLMVRPSGPRFLNFGDKFEFPVVLQNQTDKEMTVAVGARSTNAKIVDAPAKRVVVPANDRVEVRFLAAAERAGKARFQIGAAAGNLADASDVELPVWTPATTEAFATYGVVDEGAIAQPVKMPSGVFPQFGGLEVTTSSTAMQGLTDAVVYLVHYPFECNEQLASRMLAIASLRDVLAAFKSKDLPSPPALEASMAADLERLKTRQKWDGGWAFWWGEEWPFVSIHVAHAIARAEAKGYKVDPSMRSRALGWLGSVESHIPAFYSVDARRALVAYALYVRRLLKDPDPGRAHRLIEEYGGADKMNLEALGWIWPTISEDKRSKADNDALRRAVANRVTETAGAAHFITSYGDGDYLLLHSDRRADGLLLEAMMLDQPDSDLIPKLVKGLLAHRKAGRWGSTQENAFVLLALDAYFRKYEKVTPDFVARVWLGDKFAGDHTFHGRTTEYGEIDVPMGFLEQLKQGDLTLGKDGPGRMYFRIGMQYAPADLRPPPVDEGFTVSRTYEGAEDPADARLDASGTWHLKLGKKIRTRVSMVAPARRYHVALVDPLPAGLEPMNPALAVTGAIPEDPAAQKNADPYWYWHSTWYEHQNMRDERVEAFASLVWEGIHEYVYTSRATTPGTFVVPPPKAEEMYSPEVFGRGGGDLVVVE
jgi:uncharacterized protein YfaS (alpha-2-macroglobulin family)